MNERQQRIRANVHVAAMDAVSQQLRADDEQIVHELLQNARRAGARKVRIDCGNGLLVVTDDGYGISDPQILLSYGLTGWRTPDARIARESPTGMGLFALGRRGARIRSRCAGPAGSDTAVGPEWNASLTPAAFLRLASCAVVYEDGSSGPHGTRIEIDDTEGAWNAQNIGHWVRHYEIPIEINGVAAEQTPFLQPTGNGYVGTWRGLRIAVYRNGSGGLGSEVNFFGRIARAPELRTIRTPDANWSANVDVVQCPHLKLALPRRKHIAHDEFFEKLKVEVERRIYEAMGMAGTEVRLTHEQWERARSLGVKLAPPNAYGTRWTAATADPYRFHATSTEKLDGSPTVVPQGMPAAYQQMLARALRHNPEQAANLNLIEESPELQGFAWYDRLPAVSGIEARGIDCDGGRWLIDMSRPRRREARNRLGDKLMVVLTISDPAGGARPKVELPTDIAFENTDANTDPRDIGMVLRTGTSAKDRAELQAVLTDGFLRTTEEPDDGSYSDQEERYRLNAASALTTLSAGRTSADKDVILRLIDREIAWRVPKGHRMTIEINDHGTAEIVVTPTTAKPESSEPTPAG